MGINLGEIQQWFGDMISQPLQEDHLLAKTTPFSTPSSTECARYIKASSSLKPYERVQIYHQQYWWRLLNCLQTNFPMLTCLFGYRPFQQQIAVPYLSSHPPTHWGLCRLGDTLPAWIHDHYHNPDRYLVTQAAIIDWAATEAFFCKSYPAVDFSLLKADAALSQKLILQPSIHLFSLEGDLFTFRDTLLSQKPEFYNTNNFPLMTYGNFHFALYRSCSNVVKWVRISPGEYWMLSCFKKGNTIERVCEQLEDMGGEILEEALANMPLWFKQWTVLKWFGSYSS